MGKRDLYIIGAGGFGREVAAMVISCPMLSKLYRIAAFVDDFPISEPIDGIPVQKGVEDSLSKLPENSDCVIAIGNSIIRESIYRKIQHLSLRWPNLIHSSVRMTNPALIRKGKGVILAPGSTFTTDIYLGDFVIINLHCTIGHDVRLEEFVSIMPGCHLSGAVHCEKGVYLGTGAIVLNGLAIGSNSIVGAGSVVRNSVKENAKVAGVPATEI
jgi:sugar O-acyltransferase (sialic acid O-acetyltransferase NeuD family)